MQLKTLSQEADTNSDVLADDFLERKMDGSTFLQKFLQERKVHALVSMCCFCYTPLQMGLY